MPFSVLTPFADIVIPAKFYVDPLKGFSEGAPPNVPLPILFGTTVTTVLHYRADCNDRGVCLCVCKAASFGINVQKWLNGSRSCLWWTLLGAEGTLYEMENPDPAICFRNTLLYKDQTVTLKQTYLLTYLLCSPLCSPSGTGAHLGGGTGPEPARFRPLRRTAVRTLNFQN